MAASISEATIPREGDLQGARWKLTQDEDMSSRARRAHFEAGSYKVFWSGLAENSSVDVRSVELPQHRAAEISRLGAAGLLSLRQQPSRHRHRRRHRRRHRYRHYPDEGLCRKYLGTCS
jgi:hypothetical protein